jgi:hypothetical protein
MMRTQLEMNDREKVEDLGLVDNKQLRTERNGNRDSENESESDYEGEKERGHAGEDPELPSYQAAIGK